MHTGRLRFNAEPFLFVRTNSLTLLLGVRLLDQVKLLPRGVTRMVRLAIARDWEHVNESRRLSSGNHPGGSGFLQGIEVPKSRAV